MGADPAAPVEVRLSLALLGPLSARLAGEDLNLGGRRQRAVVALLALARGRQVVDLGPARRAVGGRAAAVAAPPACSPTSPTCVARSSPPARPGPEPGARLAAATATRWPRAPSRSTPGASSGWSSRRGTAADAGRRVELLTEALALWRGPVLGEYAGADWADAEARRLEQLRTLARERLLEARLDAGESALVVPELEALLAEDRLREERWRLLALAQYRAHRQADALATLRRARRSSPRSWGSTRAGAADARAARCWTRRRRSTAPDRPRRAGAARSARASRPRPRARAGRPGGRARPAAAARWRDTLRGGPGLAVIEGPAGIGKTSLLDQVRATARPPAATVLSARGNQLEREYGFGVVRQLFDPVLADAASREELLTGAAAGAARVFDSTVPPTAPPTASSRCCTVSTG